MDDALGLSACACKALSSYVHAGSRSSRMILAAGLCFLPAGLLSAQCCIFLLISANMWYGADRPHLLCDAGVDGGCVPEILAASAALSRSSRLHRNRQGL